MDTSRKVSVGQRLRQERELRGWSQTELARRTNIPTQNINRWENNKSLPQPHHQKMLADVFGLSIHELFTSKKENEEDRKSIDFPKQLEKPKFQTRDGLPFLGREKDIGTILVKIQEEGIRFLTLVGSPGVGKTELARQIKKQTQTQEYFSSVNFISFPTGKNIADILNEFTQFHFQSGLQGNMLLILDNCELIPELSKARRTILDFVEKYERLTILATSRVRFGRDQCEVLPLISPNSYQGQSLETLKTFPALQLFLSSVEKSDIHFQLTIENAPIVIAICHAIAGLPLAILIAASWVMPLGLEDVCTKILKRKFQSYTYDFAESDRQVSLEQLIESSYILLSQEEQRLFRRLAIFFSECFIDMAEAVCNLGDLPEDEAVFANLVNTLRRHSLITFENGWIQISHSVLYDFALRKPEEEEKDHSLLMRRQVIDFYDIAINEYINARVERKGDEKVLQWYRRMLDFGVDNFRLTYLLYSDLIEEYVCELILNVASISGSWFGTEKEAITEELQKNYDRFNEDRKVIIARGGVGWLDVSLTDKEKLLIVTDLLEELETFKDGDDPDDLASKIKLGNLWDRLWKEYVDSIFKTFDIASVSKRGGFATPDSSPEVYALHALDALHMIVDAFLPQEMSREE
ncbi:MAG TPA: helix-turn-helix domain-containing protein [Ktedonobacteraceae bacterium]|nr:helix-turn-helix domain-containing protein [Ktedonobacteraceae bacterium]